MLAYACHLASFYVLIGLLFDAHGLNVQIFELGMKWTLPLKTRLFLLSERIIHSSFYACLLLIGSRDSFCADREHVSVFILCKSYFCTSGDVIFI